MIGRKNYLYNNLEDTDTKEILTEFVKQYYIKNENVPSKIMISEEILDKYILENILSEDSNRKIEIRNPQK